MSETQDPQSTEGTPAPTAKGGSTAVWLALIVVLCCGLAIFKGCTGDSDGNSGALIACKHYVKDRLKSPGTADFSGLSMDGSGSRVTVSGDVDSQNSFGGVVRNSFTCTVSGSGDAWSLISLTGLTN